MLSFCCKFWGLPWLGLLTAFREDMVRQRLIASAFEPNQLPSQRWQPERFGMLFAYTS